jgi:tetratricopeptide (TPR) repeat protein
MAYHTAGKLPEAIRLYEQVKEVREKKLGADHPDTLTTLNNLAAAYWSAKQLDKSIPLFEDVLKRMEVKLGRDHPNTLRTIANLGVNYRDAGRLEEALPLLEEVHQKGKPHASLAWVEAELLSTYVKAGKTKEASNLIGSRLATARKRLPADSPQLAGQLVQAGSDLLDLKQYDDAEPLLRECLKIREKKEADAWTTFNTQSMLGEALLAQKKHADAEPLLLKGYQGLKERAAKIPAEVRLVRLSEALQRLVKLYEATGKKDEAAKWRKELAATKAQEKPKP